MFVSPDGFPYRALLKFVVNVLRFLWLNTLNISTIPSTFARPDSRNAAACRMSNLWIDGLSKLLRGISVPSAFKRPPLLPVCRTSTPEFGVTQPLSP